MNNHLSAEEELYALPVVFKSRLKPRAHLIYGLMVSLFAGLEKAIYDAHGRMAGV
ncbi:hypothetical protein [Cohnella sp. GCM10012308]|uniref:hypothetical protein n=1 Tax=Cohnella sp. GCM10012308 TaxID=3317329 RepID=UPI00360B9162